MTWHFVSDSSCDLFELEGAGADFDFTTVPFAIQIGSHKFLDEREMDIDAMLHENENSAEIAHTACPSLQTSLERFSKPGPVLAFTISSALAGSSARPSRTTRIMRSSTVGCAYRAGTGKSPPIYACAAATASSQSF